MRRDRGFTLMELMIVMAIIMILAGAIVVRLSTSTQGAKIAKATKECEEIATAIKNFYLDTGGWPGDKYYTNAGDAGLLTAPESSDHIHNDKGDLQSVENFPNYNWNGPYLETEKMPIDPWGNGYGVYTKVKALVVYSVGPNGNLESNTDDAFGKGKASGDDIVILVNIYEN